MLDLFTIFGKGGIVLWCFQEGTQLFASSVNELIKEVILQERSNTTIFKHNGLTVKFKLDNEFELVFLMVYQDVIQLSYADKLLSDVQLEFRDRYKNQLHNSSLLMQLKHFQSFDSTFQKCYKNAQKCTEESIAPVMRTFEQSEKSKKTVESLIVQRPGEKEKPKNNQATNKKPTKSSIPLPTTPKNASPIVQHKQDEMNQQDGELTKNREAFFKKMIGGNKKEKPKQKNETQNEKTTKKGKENRVWNLSGKAEDAAVLDYSLSNLSGDNQVKEQMGDQKFIDQHLQFVGQYKGELPGIDEDSASATEGEEEGDNSDQSDDIVDQKSSGWFSSFKSLVGNKTLTTEDIKMPLEKMRDSLIAKNVAAEIAGKLCQSVGGKLEGKVIGTFSRVASTVKETLRESLVQILSPKRRVNILRDVADAKSQNRPYVIVFCGVNGVGKSTNLAKITFWLNENGHRVLIAAGDTFRAGAVEQLRTHTKHLNALHPQSVQLYEQGYGKDPAGLAAQAISIAAERKIDVVLVDTAGRMQDNEPLMRALSKLITVNEPHLVLFVGEALVGNEAVDQLVKFNKALADNALAGSQARLIDGIVLTKFDTIDDKVGAAISMTYITGQPIVFVGTGQTYKDLKNLNANSVVNSLLK